MQMHTIALWVIHALACQMCVARRISGRISLTLNAQGVVEQGHVLEQHRGRLLPLALGDGRCDVLWPLCC